jgi:hypothetical protein
LPPDTYSIGLHLYNSDGALVTQGDYGLSNDAFSCTWTKLAVENLAAGDYSLQMIVYAWQTGERLAAEDGDSEQRIVLGDVRID